MKQNTIQTNFTSGEISPLMYGRTDVNKYQNGAAKLINFLVRPQGGICRRQGTLYVDTPTLGAGPHRLIPFVISSTQSYVLCFTNLYLTFYLNGAVVGGTSSPYYRATPYAFTELNLITYAQSADVMYLAHPNHAPMVLTLNADASWTLQGYQVFDGPYLEIDTSNNRLQLQLVSDTCTMISSVTSFSISVTATASASLFVVGQATNYFILSNAQPGYVGPVYPVFVSTAYVDATHLTGNLIPQSSLVTLGAYTYATGQLTAHFNGFFSPHMVGFYVFDTTNSTYYVVTGYTSATIVTATALNVISPGAVTIVISGGGSFITADVGKYVEYIVDGVWYLALIQSINAYNSAQVQPLPNIVVNSGSFDVTMSGGATTATSTFSGVFSSSDIGKYVRSTVSGGGGAGVWMLITAFSTSSVVTGTAIISITYSYPNVTMTLLDNRATIVTLTSLNPIYNIPGDLGVAIGIPIRLQFASQWRTFQATNIISATMATGYINDFMPFDLINAQNSYNGGFADKFQLGAWSTENGWPAVVAFFEQRIVWASTSLQPTTFWMSHAADFNNMGPTEEDGSVIATDAITVTIAFGDISPITWMKPGQVLLVGTSGCEYEISDPTGGGISPTNIAIIPQSYYGSLTPTIAFRFGVATLFLQRGGNKLREMLYQFQFNSFNSKDVSIISEHIMREHGGAIYMAQQVDPVSVFWITCADGTLVSCTYDRDQDVVAFAQHQLAGGATVLNACVVPNGNRDDVYLATLRDGYYNLELLSPLFDTATGDTLSTMNFLDGYSVYSGAAVTTIGNIPTGTILCPQTHAVYAIGNGILYGPFTYNPLSPSVTLPVACTHVVIGVPYTSTLGSLSPDGASNIGSSQGKRKRITEMTVRVKDSLPFKHGPSLSQLTLIDSANFCTDLNASGTAGQLQTGDCRVSVDQAWDTQAAYYIVQDQPFPLTIDCTMPVLNSNE